MTQFEASSDTPVPRHLVLVTGAARSGTSTVAGVFYRLGFHVPMPVLKANESNPRGFYESWWPVRFHNKLMKRAGISNADTRPEAAMLMDAALDDRTRNRLRGWLDEQFETSPLVMVKDPRAAWASELWVDAAERVGGDVRFVTMLRHPVEVITSRRTYYAGERPASEMRAFAIRHLGGWINQNLTLESRNRDQRRVFLRYTDLLSDWRTSVARMLSELDLAEYSPTQRVDAEIDQFIDPALRRHQPDWDKLEVPSALSEIGKHAWTALGQLTRGSGRDSAVELTLDSIAATYSELYSDAEAICFDRTALRTRAAFESGRRQGSQEEVEKLAHTAKHDDATTSSGRISRAWLKRGLRWLRRTARRLVRQA